MRLHRLDECRDDEPADHANLTLLISPDDAAEPSLGTLRVVGVVRNRGGEPVPGATLDWWHPAEGDGSALADGGVDLVGPTAPDGTAIACDRGSFDVTAGDPEEHLKVVVSADGYAPLEVRLVPLPGLPAISPPIARSGRAPLAVRPGAADQVESWCEFLLSPLD